MKAVSRAGGIVPAVLLDPSNATPLYQQFYAGIRREIERGALRAGTQLASSRVLCSELGISRFTVLTGLGMLVSEGYLTARMGAGTFVANQLPDTAIRAEAPRPAGTGARTKRTVAPQPSRRGQMLAAVEITGPRGIADEPRAFRPRRSPVDAFPLETWKRLLRKQWSRSRHEILDYGDPAGYAPLREVIAEHVNATRGVQCTAEQVIVTSGAQQAAALLFRTLLDPGDSAWIEEPGLLDVRGALVESGARIVPVSVSASGIDVAAGRRAAPRARLAYVSPSHQYPTGATLSRARRLDLLRWAESAKAWIVEDDYDSYFRYEGQPLPAVQSLDAERAGEATRVAYIGTFSKTMYPSLRLGYCIVPRALVRMIANARAIADRNSPLVEQAALAEFIRGGYYDRHLRRLRTICVERYVAMCDALSERLHDVLTLQPMHAGTHIVVTLNPEIVRQLRSHVHGTSPARAIATAAAASGLVVFPMDRYYMGRAPEQQLILGYGGITIGRIRAGVERLATTIEGLLGS